MSPISFPSWMGSRGRGSRLGVVMLGIWHEGRNLQRPRQAAGFSNWTTTLARLEIEFAHHGGRPALNGKLTVTFDDFEAYGIHRHSIAPALRELEALGFIERTRKG